MCNLFVLLSLFGDWNCDLGDSGLRFVWDCYVSRVKNVDFRRLGVREILCEGDIEEIGK